MSLWGTSGVLTDDLAGAPKWLTHKYTFDGTTAGVIAGNVLTIANHGIENGSRVKLTNGTGSFATLTDSEYWANVQADGGIKLYDTWDGTTWGSLLTLSAAGTGHSIQVIPTDVAVAAAKTRAGVANLFFVDKAEAETGSNRTKGFSVPGWYVYEEYAAADGSARKNVELLCAISAGGAAFVDATGDAGIDSESTEDSTVAASNVLITISSDLSAASTVADTATITYSVTAGTKDAEDANGVTFDAQWQVSTDGGDTFTNTGSADTGNAGSGTAVTLAVVGSASTNGNIYRVVLSAANADDVISTASTLTVTGL
jgi:hypothetical protein